MIDVISEAHNKRHSSGQKHPPKPRLTVRVGITGHRSDKLDMTSTDSVRRHLPTLFASIEKAALEILAENKDVYIDELPRLRLVSGFADGSDQIAVGQLPIHWAIEAVLPFPREEFAKDFAESDHNSVPDGAAQFRRALGKATSTTALPVPLGAREMGYVGMGNFLLRQIDILIAIWDGEAAKPGGTGAVVMTAVEDKIPVVWISMDPDRVPSMLERFEPEGNPIVSSADCRGGPLQKALACIFGAPKAPDRIELTEYWWERRGTDQRSALERNSA